MITMMAEHDHLGCQPGFGFVIYHVKIPDSVSRTYSLWTLFSTRPFFQIVYNFVNKKKDILTKNNPD